MTNPFQRATRAKARLRLALIGPSGSGKTWTALALGHRLAERAGGRMAVVDTERGSASLYSDRFDFDVLELPSFSPQQYMDAIRAAESAGYAVIVLDSISHAWAGPGGVIEFVDATAKKMQSGNSFSAWREGTKLQNTFVDAMLSSSAHIVATMRSKQDWVQEKDSSGRTVIRKVGMQPVQREGLDYEFTITGDLDDSHTLIIGKSRMEGLADRVVTKPGSALADEIATWLESGVDATPRPEPEPPQQPAPVTNGQPPMPEAQAVARPPARQQPAAQQSAPPAGGGWQDRPATEPQIKAIYAISRGMHGMDPEDVDDLCRQRFGCEPGELSRRTASEFIDAIKLLKPDAQGSEPDTSAAPAQSALSMDAPVERPIAAKGA